MTAQVREIDVATLGPLVKIAGGGQGLVYGLRDDPDGPVYKEYLPRVVDDLDIDALGAFVRFTDELTGADRAALFGRVAWPEAVVRRDGVVRGFLMRRVPPEYHTKLRFGADASDELATAQFLLNPPEYLAKVGLRVTQRFRAEFLADTADALALLHRLDVVVGDLSPNNLLFSLTNRPRCFFVDSDSMRLAGQSVLPQVETPDWRVGDVGDVGDEELGTPASDVYKFGLLVARLFAADQHTTDLAAIPIRLRRHVGRCLAADSRQRPRMREVLAPIERTLRGLPDTEPEEEPEPEPVPRQRPAPVRNPEPPARRSAPGGPAPAGARRFVLWGAAAAAGALLAVVVGALSGSDGGSGPPPALPRNTYTYTPPVDLPYPDYTIPDYPVNPFPTDLFPFPSILPLSCLTESGTGVRGGEGLAAARVAVGELCGAAPADLSPQLREHAPYRSADLVGFFGEGGQEPTATVDLTDQSGRCWRMSVGFDADYTVRSVGPLSACG